MLTCTHAYAHTCTHMLTQPLTLTLALTPNSAPAPQTLDGHKDAGVMCTTWNPVHRKLTTSDENGYIIVYMLVKNMWYVATLLQLSLSCSYYLTLRAHTLMETWTRLSLAEAEPN